MILISFLYSEFHGKKRSLIFRRITKEIYTYIYRERDKERERERGIERVRERKRE